MENASKALIMAGAVLVAILIVSLSVVIFNNFSKSVKDNANMDEQEIANFNSKLTPYMGENISGSQVNALIQLVISINRSAISSNELGRTVTITYPSTGGDVEISANNPNGNNENATKKVETGVGISYNVKSEYGDNGLINKITVIKNPKKQN